jgi:hypothetical protein
MDAPAMTLLAVNDPLIARAAGLALGLVSGGILGLIHFRTLAWTARLFAAGSVLRAAALQAGRFAVVAAALLGLARLGAGPLLAGLAGIVLARQRALHGAGGRP